MSDFEKFLKDAMYTTIGAAAVITEKSAEVVKGLADKGAEILNNKDAADALTRKGREVMEKSGAALDDICQKVKEAVTTETFVINVADLTKEEREILRQQLDKADEADAAAPDDETVETAEVAEDAEEAEEVEVSEEVAEAEEADEAKEAEAVEEISAEEIAEDAVEAEDALDEPNYSAD